MKPLRLSDFGGGPEKTDAENWAAYQRALAALEAQGGGTLVLNVTLVPPVHSVGMEES